LNKLKKIEKKKGFNAFNVYMQTWVMEGPWICSKFIYFILILQYQCM